MSEQATSKTSVLRIERFGPVADARVTFGDLTVLVGPQASGKSIFLQSMKLAADRNHVLGFFEDQNVHFNDDPAAVINGYFGRGMGSLIDAELGPEITWSGQKYNLAELTRFKRPKTNRTESLFYIPAQRVVSMPSGRTQTFGSFDFGDPFVLRYFAHQVHILLQNEFAHNPVLFPAKNRLNETLRAPIAEAFFGGASLGIEPKEYTKSMTLKMDGLKEGLPFLAWSAGQREFVPLLLGIYWLCPAGKTSRRDQVEWVIIEEPEMGLHPKAIQAFLLIVLELMKRGYKVVLSTHSPVVLDLIWSINQIREFGGDEKSIRELFDLNSNPFTKALASNALEKDFRVYYFERGQEVVDISALDPMSDNLLISEWGNLTHFSSRAAETVAKVVSSRSLSNLK